MLSYSSNLGIVTTDDESEDEWMASIFAKHARDEADDVYQRTPAKRVAFDPSNSPWAPRPPQPPRPSPNHTNPPTSKTPAPAVRPTQDRPSDSATRIAEADRRMPRNRAAFNVPPRDPTSQARTTTSDKAEAPAADKPTNPAVTRSRMTKSYSLSEEVSAKLAEDLGREMALTISKNVRIQYIGCAALLFNSGTIQW